MDNSKIYLVQTDTTVGFLSNNKKELSIIKKRDLKQEILQTLDSFKTLKLKIRVPPNRRGFIRRVKNTTFIYPNGLSFRVVDRDSSHHRFIKKFNSLYSTSANITKQNFNEDFAVKHSDIILYTKEGFKEKQSSKIYKIYKTKIKRIR
jgi:tRNA A37 threonylcarbamoyladenosine synthetase subunit TsaC/SUA5/YrdC